MNTNINIQAEKTPVQILMENERWNTNSLAKKLNRSHDTVRRWVTGETQPPVGDAIRINCILKGESVEATWGFLAS